MQKIVYIRERKAFSAINMYFYQSYINEVHNRKSIFKVKILVVLLLCYISSDILKGQSLHLKFTHITSQDGLPQNTIHGINKDKYGFMWFGTWSGLCRY